MKRRDFLKKTMATAGAMTLSNRLARVAFAQAADKKPNILWLIAENFSPLFNCSKTEFTSFSVFTRMWAQ